MWVSQSPVALLVSTSSATVLTTILSVAVAAPDHLHNRTSPVLGSPSPAAGTGTSTPPKNEPRLGDKCCCPPTCSVGSTTHATPFTTILSVARIAARLVPFHPGYANATRHGATCKRPRKRKGTALAALAVLGSDTSRCGLGNVRVLMWSSVPARRLQQLQREQSQTRARRERARASCNTG